MYKQYYRLKEEPFNITPDPAFFFLSPSHKEALASVLYGVEKRKGFISITGEVGSGKTTVLRAYLDRIDTEQIKVVYLFNPNVSFKGLLETILRELGFHAPASEVFEMVNHLAHVLVEEFRQNRNIVLVIDEAQNIPVETLESLRMLSNLETASTKLIQIVLVGQPELNNLLDRHELRQLKQRIAVRVGIRPLTRDESFQYIEYRLNKAALKKTKVFTAGALKRIVRGAAGIPRILNILCDNCLISGYGYQEKPITRRIAKEVIADFRSPPVSPVSRWGFAAAAVLILSLGLWVLFTYHGKAFSNWQHNGGPETALLAARAPNALSPSVVAPPPSSDPAGGRTPSETRQARRLPSQTQGISMTETKVPSGQGGPSERIADALAPVLIPTAGVAVGRELAKRIGPEQADALATQADHDASGTDASTPGREPTAGARPETPSGDQVHMKENSLFGRSVAKVPANVSSPAADTESREGPPDRSTTDARGDAREEDSLPDPDSEMLGEPRAQQEVAAIEGRVETEAGPSSPDTAAESPALLPAPAEDLADDADTAASLGAAPRMPTALAPPAVTTPSDVSEPWSRARTLLQQGRIEEAGALWQSTYLDHSADRIAIEVELNCQPETLLETYEMLSAPEDFYILPYRHQGKLCYRVRLGPYATWSEASSRAQEIKGAMWYAKPRLKRLAISSGGG